VRAAPADDFLQPRMQPALHQPGGGGSESGGIAGGALGTAAAGGGGGAGGGAPPPPARAHGATGQALVGDTGRQRCRADRGRRARGAA